MSGMDECQEHEHTWVRHQNVTSKGTEMPPYEACECGVARSVAATVRTTYLTAEDRAYGTPHSDWGNQRVFTEKDVEVIVRTHRAAEMREAAERWFWDETRDSATSAMYYALQNDADEIEKGSAWEVGER